MIRKTSRLQKTLGYSAFGVFLAFTVFFALIEPNILAPTKKDPFQPAFTFEDVRITQLDKGIIAWKIESDQAQISHDNQFAILKEIRGQFFDKKKRVAQMTAPQAVVDMKDANMALNDAQAKFDLGDRQIKMVSDSLNWDAVVQRFVAEGNVRVDSGKIALFGDRFEVDLPQRRLVISRGSRAEIIP